MKTAKRVQLLLSPVLIAMLTIMLAVVSFGWYQANVNTEITVKDASVSITVEEPEGLDVSYKLIGDSYTYSGGIYTLINYGSNGPTGVVGYYGQTAEYPVDSSENDKPYIAFYEITVTGGDNISSAYVDSLQIKLGNTILLETTNWENEDESKFRIKFYTSEDNGKTLANESKQLTLNEGKTYMGIHFSNPNSEVFDYSDIKYYGSTYTLGITFVE